MFVENMSTASKYDQEKESGIFMIMYCDIRKFQNFAAPGILGKD